MTEEQEKLVKNMRDFALRGLCEYMANLDENVESLVGIIDELQEKLSDHQRNILKRMSIDEREYRMVEGQWKSEAGRMDKAHIPFHDFINLPENLAKIIRFKEGK